MTFQSLLSSFVRVKKPGPVNIDSTPLTSINCFAIPPTS